MILATGDRGLSKTRFRCFRRCFVGPKTRYIKYEKNTRSTLSKSFPQPRSEALFATKMTKLIP